MKRGNVERGRRTELRDMEGSASAFVRVYAYSSGGQRRYVCQLLELAT